MPQLNSLTRFEQTIVPHLDAAYNLARWLTRDDHDAEDVVQETYLRAWQHFDSFHGTEGRAWLLAIVRNTCYTFLERNRAHELATTFEEERHGSTGDIGNPVQLLLQNEDRQLVRQALEALPVAYREVLVLRELEGFSYKDIAGVTGIALGTVMSRLARGRERLQRELARRLKSEDS